MTRFRCLLLRLFATSVLLPHHVQCAARQWVPFGTAESKPAPGVPYAAGVDKTKALGKEYDNKDGLISNSENSVYSSPANVRLRENCGETLSIPTHDRKLGNVNATVVEPGLHWSAVLISNDGQYRCGATFISRRHLITAGSCFRLPKLAGTQDGVVGLGLYWTMSCHLLIHDMYKEECERHALYGRYWLNMTGAFYVFNVSKDYLRSTVSYLEDIAIIELTSNLMFKRSDVRPACVPSKNDTFLHKNAFSFALVRSEADALTAGRYEKQHVPLMNASKSKSDKWHTDACNTTGIQCVTIPYRSKKLDFWILPGVGVFDKVEGSKKDWHLYGYVLEVVPDDKRQHYHVVIRLVQGLLTTLCYFAGVCSDVSMKKPPWRSAAEVNFNMAYTPGLHNGTEMWRLPNGTSLPRDNCHEEHSDYTSQFRRPYDNNASDHFNGRFNNVANNEIRKHDHNHKKHDGRIDKIELDNYSYDTNVFFYNNHNQSYPSRFALPKYDDKRDNAKNTDKDFDADVDDDGSNIDKDVNVAVDNLCADLYQKHHFRNVDKDVNVAVDIECADHHRKHHNRCDHYEVYSSTCVLSKPDTKRNNHEDTNYNNNGNCIKYVEFVLDDEG